MSTASPWRPRRLTIMPDTERQAGAGQNCDLCGLPCGHRPYLQRIHDEERSFCCLGCMNVYLILSETGDWVFAHFEGIGDGWLRREDTVQ